VVFIDDGLFVELVESFRLPDGRLYSIVLIGPGAHGRVEVRVAPGSRFEVVTPSVIAGVRGTRFVVRADAAAGRERTAIEVLSGVVEVWHGPRRDRLDLLTAAQGERRYPCPPAAPGGRSVLLSGGVTATETGLVKQRRRLLARPRRLGVW